MAVAATRLQDLNEESRRGRTLLAVRGEKLGQYPPSDGRRAARDCRRSESESGGKGSRWKKRRTFSNQVCR